VPIENHPHESDDNDSSDDDFGPMPLPGSVDAAQFDSTLADFEARSNAQKEAILNAGKPKDPTRESWMTELPEAFRKDFGMEGRTFRQSYTKASMDKDGWTSTPQDAAAAKPKKAAPIAHDPKAKLASKRNQNIDATVQNFNSKHRGQSLVEMHAAKRHKEDEAKAGHEPGGKKERRRFDPAVDVHGSHVSNTQRKSMIKKASAFQDRFSRGTYS
jgi:hypothetical protein